ncbi:hypothetical protein [Ornithinimicrobium kibberense]|uniref:hypothetical protein n=1 Tax=Ornithinimicrobium kibberense TaxID=282060 RepID=UPI0036218459
MRDAGLPRSYQCQDAEGRAVTFGAAKWLRVTVPSCSPRTCSCSPLPSGGLARLS